MHIANLDIEPSSEWVTATPAAADILPFYITEIGHFYALNQYSTEREGNDSHMLLYTLSGEGVMEADGSRLTLQRGYAVVVDCMKHHLYRTKSEKWDFIWLHIKGAGVSGIAEAVNYKGVSAVRIQDRAAFEAELEQLLHDAKRPDLKTLSGISLGIHKLFDIILQSELSDDSNRNIKLHIPEIEQTIRFIHENYAEPIGIEDMVERVHLSKFYFIRIFKQYTGATPYNYLVNHRINQSKVLLRTTDLSISEIALKTGFADTSSFNVRQTASRPRTEKIFCKTA